MELVTTIAPGDLVRVESRDDDYVVMWARWDDPEMFVLRNLRTGTIQPAHYSKVSRKD